MKTITYTEFRNSMKETMDLAVESSETIIVQRSGGKSVVIISLEEYNSILETRHLLSNKANSKRLEKSIKNLEEGKTRKISLNEL